MFPAEVADLGGRCKGGDLILILEDGFLSEVDLELGCGPKVVVGAEVILFFTRRQV